MILETERLMLRQMDEGDFDALCRIMCDEETMRTAYERAFTPEEVRGWLQRQLDRYRDLGYGLWAVVLKATGEVIGQCGLTQQPWEEESVLEIGYLFNRAYWHNGYAAEAAVGCRRYAFDVLGADEVCSIIRDTNIPSQNVAIRNGMTLRDESVKFFRGTEMRVYRYVATK